MSWYQPKPEVSLSFVDEFKLPLSAKIIDVGGGDSFLADHLLARGFEDITVLDISETAIEKAKQRLGDSAKKVHWIVADITKFRPVRLYDFWHDRAAFHFLTDNAAIRQYLKVASKSIRPEGIAVVGTFSERGPDKCSGVAVRKYSEKTLSKTLETFFRKIRCIAVDHITPSQAIQHFTFCSFQKRIAGE